MSSETVPWDAALIELFRSEVETHSDLLNAALLALERSPGDTSRIDEMMRAAHSIKGASRVVGVDPAVRVAHAMEDCFVAAQRGTLKIAPADVDVLLRGVDLLGKISAATREQSVNLADAFRDAVSAAISELQDVLSGKARSGSGITSASVIAGATSDAGRDQAETESPAVPLVNAAAPTATTPTASDVTIAFPVLLDSAAAEAIRTQLLRAIDSRCESIRFDLTATQDLDVQGLALLAAAPRHLARYSRTSLRLAGVSRQMATVLRVTGLGEHYGIHDSSGQRAD